jgi:hypothetical protein
MALSDLISSGKTQIDSEHIEKQLQQITNKISTIIYQIVVDKQRANTCTFIRGKYSEDTVGEILLNNLGNVILHENSGYFRSDRIIKS